MAIIIIIIIIIDNMLCPFNHLFKLTSLVFLETFLFLDNHSMFQYFLLLQDGGFQPGATLCPRQTSGNIWRHVLSSQLSQSTGGGGGVEG